MKRPTSSQLGWQFTDESGRGWNGDGAVEPASDKGKFVMTLKIKRG
jgi:hypothetical protein